MKALNEHTNNLATLNSPTMLLAIFCNYEDVTTLVYIVVNKYSFGTF